MVCVKLNRLHPNILAQFAPASGIKNGCGAILPTDGPGQKVQWDAREVETGFELCLGRP